MTLNWLDKIGFQIFKLKFHLLLNLFPKYSQSTITNQSTKAELCRCSTSNNAQKKFSRIPEKYQKMKNENKSREARETAKHKRNGHRTMNADQVGAHSRRRHERRKEGIYPNSNVINFYIVHASGGLWALRLLSLKRSTIFFSFRSMKTSFEMIFWQRRDFSASPCSLDRSAFRLRKIYRSAVAGGTGRSTKLWNFISPRNDFLHRVDVFNESLQDSEAKKK